MTPEQEKNMTDNVVDFNVRYTDKYTNGQKEHGGNMWEMGAYQALEQMEQEVLDQWSYCRQIRKCFDEIRLEVANGNSGNFSPDAYDALSHIEKILNRVKED